MKQPGPELVPTVQQLIELLPLTWFPNLVNLLPLEQLEISSTDRLGLQRAAQEDGVDLVDLRGHRAEPQPLHPLPSRVVPEALCGEGERALPGGQGAPRSGICEFWCWGGGTEEL